ncbi:sensor histidine kinase [Paenibacillus glycanilyticus]|uniref:histidine kinase n=1 Tax=Paenibacillus glycanilyticus TaxID=126569 RepID=A0ABQ6G9J0_9BACL|nr:HAMP domain-containing sensor histidine kinase [Paenibacillus glycanilyticus]GLX66923.1 sensor histidine kinase [Paenibacillus glycanilyticus]
MRIKSLTLRIWMTISIFICSIVIVILVLFAFIMKDNDEESARHAFEFTHAIMLDAIAPNDLDENTKQSFESQRINHFVYDQAVGQIKPVIGVSSGIDELLLDRGLALIDDHQSHVFTSKVNNKFYLAQISEIKGQTYLISYKALDCDEDMYQIIMAGILIILISLPISKLIANNIGRPLRKLEGYTRQIANKEWDSQLEIKREDEIGRLASSMKEMKEALKIADEEERKFLQSISHDLKTPVMIIASHAQAIMDGMYEHSAQEPSAIIKAEALRLERKIQLILYLNTLDYVLDNDKNSEEVYLDKILSYLVRNFKTIDSELTWELSGANREAVMLANPDRIRVAIENVLENQLRFARHSISITLIEDGLYWLIEIRNDGPLLTEEELKHLFQSFYKGTKGNFGLGLSITKKIVDHYRGTINVQNDNGYVCFRISFPKSS